MNGHHFDDLTRRLAVTGAARLDRRTLLRAFGLGGAATAVRGHAAPSATAQTTAIVRAPSGPTVERKAAEFLYDPEAIFRFVRDEIRYDPYAGALRGARGTLWGLAGNSVDQALLLAALLNEALVVTRFVVGELTEDAANRLLASTRLDVETTRTHAARLFLPMSSPEDQPISPTPEAEAWARGLPEFAQRFRDAVDRLVDDGLATVLDALAAADITLPEPATTLPDLERRQHVWLQFADGGHWIDLDPSLPEAEPGAVHATAIATHDRLPDELVHRVAFRLVAEQVVGGVPTRHELLTYEAASADLVGVPVTLFHPQAEALKALGVTIAGAIDGYRNFMPNLLVGEQTVSGKPVTFGTGGGLLGALGDTGAVEGDTLAEWLEIDILTPSGQRHIVREVFDRVGAERRAAGPVDPATVPPVDLVAAGDPESSFLPLAGMWSLAVVTGPIPAGAFDRDPAAAIGIADLAAIAHSYHFARDAFALRDTAVPGYRIYLDAPNLTAFVLRPTTVAANGQSALTGIDLLHRSVATVPIAGAAPAVHPLVAAGVLGHAVEQAAVESAGEEPLNLPVRVTSGVSRVFAEAKRQGVRTLVLRPGDAGASLPAVGEAARQRIEEALNGGYVVIVPERSVTLGGVERSGWWLVNLTTGDTLDQMDDGGGASMTEMGLLLVKVVACGLTFFALGVAVGYAAAFTMFNLQADAAFDSATSPEAVVGAMLVRASATGARAGATGALAGASASGLACFLA